MPTGRVLCIGNRYHPADWVGPAVYDFLSPDPDEHIEVIDGGLLGLDLLHFFEGVERIVIADTLLCAGKGITVIEEPQMDASMLRFDHGGGLPVLIGANALLNPHPPKLWVAGIDATAPRALIESLAHTCRALARGEACCD